MSDDLQDLFREEVTGYIAALNAHLLRLDLETAADYAEMQRIAHSMKGAARVVAQALIETVGHYLEEIFGALAEQQTTHLSPARVDMIYDSLDLITNALSDALPSHDVQATVLHNLERLLADLTETAASASQEFPTMTPLNQNNFGSTAELVNIFWVEVKDYLAQLNNHLLQLELVADEERAQLIQEMNRLAHSMKGAAQAVDYPIVQAISNYLEEIFGAAQHDKLIITAQIADVIYDGLDLIASQLQGVQEEPEVIAAVLMQLQRLLDHQPSTSNLDAALVTSTLETGQLSGTPTMILRAQEETIRVAVSKLDQLMAASGEILVNQMRGAEQQRLLATLQKDHSRLLREWRAVRATYIRVARRLRDQPTSLEQDIAVLFNFLEVNQRHLATTSRELTKLRQTMTQDSLQLNLLADDLQSTISKLRMMPFDSIVGGFQRLGRDLARESGKQVHFEVLGTGVDVDKAVLDALKDPLMHLLRNAIDHGIEPPDIRQQAGKPRAGRVSMTVEQRGSEIQIEVSDDGYGLDLDQIRQVAIERELLTAVEAQALSDDDAKMLILQSGFTTSEQVTALSGRGLGMDIVDRKSVV